MDNDKEMREKLSKALGARVDHAYGKATQNIYSWEEIFTEIGKLLERAKEVDIQKNPFTPIRRTDEQPEVTPNYPRTMSQPHYHSGSPCWNNPCDCVDNSIDTTCRE